MEKQFIPYHKIGTQKVIVVDGLHPKQLTLSHWKGTNNHKNISADTSGKIVLNAIAIDFDGVDCQKISATHFDIDGFVGVFALFFPKLALEYKAELTAMAKIGDFREFNPTSATDHYALKLCCWINKVEKEKFYRPFEEKEEIESCVEKFDFFIPKFKEVLEDIEQFKSDWETEYEQVKTDLLRIESQKEYTKIGLVVKEISEPIHYYALFSETERVDIVLSIYPNNKYELEYKYTTWVDIVSRPTLPRIDLKPLCNSLNLLEKSNYNWSVDKVTDTGPILRLESNGISKADRFANPFEREIYNSSIEKEEFTNLIVDYFKLKYNSISLKKNWTWKEIKQL